MKRALWLSLVVTLAGVLAALMTGAPAGGATGKRVDVHLKHPSEAVESGTLPLDTTLPTRSAPRTVARSAASLAATAEDPPIGTTRVMVVLDDVAQSYQLSLYTLRAIGEHIEVWVQTATTDGIPGTDFPAGDCRNDGDRNVVTDAQIAALIHEFDTNIYPKESAAFSVPPTRDGANAILPALLDLPPDYYAGDGDKIMTLVSNVRDTNFYDLDNTNGFSYIAGFFSGQVNDFFDRNAMTIDVFDWTHRTGANPPDEPVPGDFCLSKPARPRAYEGAFAHEYQHLLEHYEDPDEVNWVNEGLSDWAQTLTGYVNPALPITETGFDDHIQCFTGFLTVQTPVNPNPAKPGECGPENSLTRWEDQGDLEILSDYGAAYSMMELLAGRYGTSFMSALHRDDANSFAGLAGALASAGQRKVSPLDVFDDWTLAVALDGLVDTGYNILGSLKERTVQVPTLHSTILWTNPDAYSSPGAPSNGSDYVQLRNGAGAPLTGGQVNSVSFKGATTLAPLPLRWTVVDDPPGQPGDPALYSGTGVDRDEAAVTPITVPSSGGATLTFDAQWDLEDTWDFAYVQVSTDGGATYQSLPCTDTTTDHNPGAVAPVVENLPGYTGVQEWKAESCDLSAYAGKSVLLAFRVINDPAAEGNGVIDPPGFYVDDIQLGGTLISDGSSTTPFKSVSETRPTAVTNFTVRLISIETGKKKITVTQLPLSGEFSLTGAASIQKYIDKKADFVAAIVTYNDPTEVATSYAGYQLTVNGVVQPGGA